MKASPAQSEPAQNKTQTYSNVSLLRYLNRKADIYILSVWRLALGSSEF